MANDAELAAALKDRERFEFTLMNALGLPDSATAADILPAIKQLRANERELVSTAFKVSAQLVQQKPLSPLLQMEDSGRRVHGRAMLSHGLEQARENLRLLGVQLVDAIRKHSEQVPADE